MDEVSIKDIPILAEDDPFFKPAVRRCRRGMTYHAFSSIAMMLVEAKGSSEGVEEWITAFRNTLRVHPDRYRAVDDSRCSQCRWNPICSIPQRPENCANFLSLQDKSWDTYVSIHINDFRNAVPHKLRYVYGFIETSEGIVQGSLTRFVDTIRKTCNASSDTSSVLFVHSPEEAKERPLLIHGIRPKFNETYDEYCNRITVLKDNILQDMMEEMHREDATLDEHERVEKALRRFIKRIGQQAILQDRYSNDVFAMVLDYWPDMDPDMIAADTKTRPGTPEITAKLWEILRKQKATKTTNKEAASETPQTQNTDNSVQL